MANYTSSVPNTPVDQGTFSYTPPTPPTTTDGALGATYTFASGGTSALTVPVSGTRGRSVNFSITTGGVQYDFQGACDTSGVIHGTCHYPSPEGADDPWTARAQGGGR